MGVVEPDILSPVFAEDIRLIIWDLDETFWDGTLSEEGMRYRRAHHDLVIELVRRGIMSAICSKNDFAQVERVLTEKGLWDYFIFPSIDWMPKGGRIKAMIEQIGLRPESILFIDDNPTNLAEAAQAVRGLNVAAPQVIPHLLNHPQLSGKPDRLLTRLAQYKVKESKARAVQAADVDPVSFLRGSDVRVYFEYDVEAHLDRAIELINRTNQLNFTKNRLPEDLDQARAQLRALLGHNTTDAALIRVCDAYGDYGFAGFYLTQRQHNARKLVHFCFSCRTLNMCIEHWVYAFLRKPALNVVGEVLSNLDDPAVVVDWITPAHIADMSADTARPGPQYDYILARGGCDLASLVHYLSLHASTIVEEFNAPKAGQMLRRDHSAHLMPALQGGLTSDQMGAAETLGYAAEDFETAIFEKRNGRGLILLSFWADADIPLYRHPQTGLQVPYWLVGAQNHDLIADHALQQKVARTDIQRARLAQLSRDFVHEGILDQAEMEARYRSVLAQLPQDVDVVMVLANERGPRHFADPKLPAHPHHRRLNDALRAVAEDRQDIVLLDPAHHIQSAEDMLDLNHFRRDVYHRMYRDLLTRLRLRDAKDS